MDKDSQVSRIVGSHGTKAGPSAHYVHANHQVPVHINYISQHLVRSLLDLGVSCAHRHTLWALWVSDSSTYSCSVFQTPANLWGKWLFLRSPLRSKTMPSNFRHLCYAEKPPICSLYALPNCVHFSQVLSQPPSFHTKQTQSLLITETLHPRQHPGVFPLQPFQCNYGLPTVLTWTAHSTPTVP